MQGSLLSAFLCCPCVYNQRNSVEVFPVAHILVSRVKRHTKDTEKTSLVQLGGETDDRLWLFLMLWFPEKQYIYVYNNSNDEKKTHTS